MRKLTYIIVGTIKGLALNPANEGLVNKSQHAGWLFCLVDGPYIEWMALIPKRNWPKEVQKSNFRHCGQMELE